MLGRKACSSCLVLLALTSIFLFYLLSEHTHKSVPDVPLLSDTSLQKLHGGGKEVQFLDDVISRPVGPHSGAGISRFVLGLNYWEQLTMATINMYQLVCLADMWNASVVRPFTLNSRLYGMQHLKAGEFLNKNKCRCTVENT